MTKQVRVLVNGEGRSVVIAPGARLIDVLRDQLGLMGTKAPCRRGECGSCTVLVDGKPVMSCIYPAHRAREVETIEGVADESRPLREAFADCGGFQCGFCTPGQVVRATALLRGGCRYTDDELRDQIAGNICRCTGYNGIVEAIQRTNDRGLEGTTS